MREQEDWRITTALLTLLLVFVSSFPALSYGVVPPRTLLNKLSQGSYLTTQEQWFNQTLDHFSPYDHHQFRQRYYEFLDYFRIPDGPIFLVIGGEGPCNGITNDYIGVLAKKFGAAMVTLEHRYYGKSSPFNSLETENLKYLSSKQALFDLAVFRQYYQARVTTHNYSWASDIYEASIAWRDSLNAKLNRTKTENPWFVFGGSYAGALSAWFRLKFPHLTCGSLASSAVVLAVYNFTEYDQQIGESAGAECKAVLQETTQLIEHKLATNGKELKASFNADDLEKDGDFMYLIADAAAVAFQYGNPDKVCKPMVEAKNAGEDLVDAYAKYVKEYYIGTFGVNVQTYDQEYLKKTAINEDSSTRLWWFQVCTEVAFFQVAPSNDSIRSSEIDAKYHMDLCKNIFGEGIFPDVDATNLYYGGTKIAGSKIVFANGSQDPWRHASKQTSSPDLPSYTITCSNCAHCTDFRGCPQSPLVLEGNEKNCSSPDAVHKVRQQITEHMDLWLSECQEGSSYI
ncbi:Putative serine protease EDA2 [Glycine soja]|uniref:Putative serine protease EDA2 n=1 Tax=Glycine soja TaxID=3848 RepID=A0A0B2SBP9_GLYSO|nr:Putative serine protease EDA2 [Glycine soja]